MDDYGRTTVEVGTPGFPVTQFVGQRVPCVREVRYQHRTHDFAVGITVQFPGGTVRILNLADEIVLAHDRHLGPVEERLYEAATSTSQDVSPRVGTNSGSIPA